MANILKIVIVCLVFTSVLTLLEARSVSVSSAEESSEEAEDDEESAESDQPEEVKDTNKKDAVVNNNVNTNTATGGNFVQDPFVFYKWPGFGHAEGVYGRYPWYPAFFVEVEKKDKDSAEDDLAEEEDDEPQDDYHDHKHEEDEYHHHYKKKHVPTAVSSLGFSAASTDAKTTWYGVMRPKVRSGLDILEDDVEVDDTLKSVEMEQPNNYVEIEPQAVEITKRVSWPYNLYYGYPYSH